MRTLIVYYSRSGVTRAVAEQLRGPLMADIEELTDTKNRQGGLGFLSACKDAMLKKATPIEPPRTRPADYDLVIIGTPVWANTMCSAVRSYLQQNGRAIRRAAVFCTTQSSGIDKTLAEMAALCGGEVATRTGFRQKDVRRGQIAESIQTFVSAVQPSASTAE